MIPSFLLEAHSNGDSTFHVELVLSIPQKRHYVMKSRKPIKIKPFRCSHLTTLTAFPHFIDPEIGDNGKASSTLARITSLKGNSTQYVEVPQ
jgi:hypothetical protein